LSFAQQDFLASAEPHAAFSEAQHDFFDFLFLRFFFFFLSSFLISICVLLSAAKV
jgi:hypothetical protein